MGRVAVICTGLILAGCARRLPPLSPAEEQRTFRLPAGFRIELVASEPAISDAISIAFDPDGRLYVVEMPDYPLDPRPLGRIKLLDDRDGDGRYEHATVFADGLHFVEGALPWRKGVLAAVAPEVLYLEDRDGDGRADVRQPILTGFATGNPQLRLNALQYGLDNWIYAAHPRPPTPRRYVKEFGNTISAVRFADRPDAPALEVRGNDIRFRPDARRVERVSGNSQFGLAFDAWGNRFTLWNNDHVRHVVVEEEYLKKNPHLAVASAMESVSDHEAQAAVFPITRNPLVIHDTQAGRFTSACGLSIYQGGNFPAGFEGNSFTCEPVHNLVHRDILEPKGATFVARRAHEKSEFLASTDSWFRPVFTTTGPDGALYVVDYYHYTVEHPEFVPPQLLRQINFEKRHQLGRIWRVTHESSKTTSRPKLSTASSRELARELDSPNAWWRTTAQRLLVERQDRSVAGDLDMRLSPHALWTLEGLGLLRNETVLDALSHADAGVRYNAVRLAEARLDDAKIRGRVLGMASDPDARVQFQVACSLSMLPADESRAALERIARQRIDDKWFQTAVLASAGENAASWLRLAAGRDDFARRIAAIVGARKNDGEIAAALREARPAVLEGLADGLEQARGLKLPQSRAVLLGMLDSAAALRVASRIAMAPPPGILRQAAETAVDRRAAPDRRQRAAMVLGLDSTGKTAPRLAELLAPSEPQEVQLAAASALSRLPAGDVTRVFLDRWRSATAGVRRVLLAGFFAEPGRLPPLLDAIQAGTVQPWALGPARTRQLLEHADPQIRKRAQGILRDPQSDRKPVYEKYLPAITMTANADRGRPVFERACSECHKIGDTGFELGPDLRSVAQRYRETLLADILMPNENIEGGYEEYLVETVEGRGITGLLAKETPTTLLLRRRKGEEDTVLRSRVRSLRSLSVSPMPEDLEKSINLQEMADLIAYIKGLQ
ncbi:MAG: PVC-type heme-binding CxxCH protein [Bryobacteraceae bacterium]